MLHCFSKRLRMPKNLILKFKVAFFGIQNPTIHIKTRPTHSPNGVSSHGINKHCKPFQSHQPFKYPHAPSSKKTLNLKLGFLPARWVPLGVSLFLCARLCVSLCVCLFVYFCMFVCVFVNVSQCISVCVSVCICICCCVYVCIFVYVSMCVCVC